MILRFIKKTQYSVIFFLWVLCANTNQRKKLDKNI